MTTPGLVMVDGEQLHVVVRGSTGRVVVLCSGLGGSWRDWNEVSDQLATDHIVVRFDRPGLGSSPASNSVFTPTVRAEARRIAATLDAVGHPAAVTVVGHSLGGFFAEGFARLYPDRTASVLLLDSSVAEQAGLQLLPKRSKAASHNILTRLTGALGTHGDYLGAVLRENAAYSDLGEEVLALRQPLPIPPVPIVVAAATGRNRTPWAKKWLAQQRGLAQCLGADFSIIAPASHRVMVDRPDDTARVIRELTHS
jgi:pimeloyl-ACP methyl ester carboxylesterase